MAHKHAGFLAAVGSVIQIDNREDVHAYYNTYNISICMQISNARFYMYLCMCVCGHACDMHMHVALRRHCRKGMLLRRSIRRRKRRYVRSRRKRKPGLDACGYATRVFAMSMQ